MERHGHQAGRRHCRVVLLDDNQPTGSHVLSKVAKAKKEGSYPGVPGYATIAFLIGDKGEVASSKIERAAGDPSVSKEAIDMIARGAPYPPPPPGADRMFVVTLEFRATQ